MCTCRLWCRLTRQYRRPRYHTHELRGRYHEDQGNRDGPGQCTAICEARASTKLHAAHLGPGASTTVTVRYAPESTDGDFGSFIVISNASNASSARIDLRGHYDGSCEAILRCSPEFTAFGTVEVGSSGLRSVPYQPERKPSTSRTSASWARQRLP